MPYHASHGLGQRVFIDATKPVGRFAPAHLAAQARQLPAVEPHYAGPDTEAEKRQALGYGRQERPLLPQLEAQGCWQEFADRRQDPVQPGLPSANTAKSSM